MELIHLAGAHICHHNIALGDEPAGDLLTLFGRDVDGNALLVQVCVVECGRGIYALKGIAVHDGALTRLIHALHALDLDDIRAKIAEQ